MNKKVVIFLSVSLGVVLLLGIMLTRQEPREPIIFSGESGSYPERSLNDLIYEADAVVVGEFESALPSRWSTPDGKLPDGATAETVFGNLYIYTEYIFRVENLLKGNQPESTVLIRTFGGQVGEDIMTVSSNEAYETGQTYLLFLLYDPRLAKDGDPGPFLVFGQRVYTVTDGKAVSWEDEWNVEELSDYIKNSPLAGSTVNIPDSPEAKEIMQVVKAAYDIEIEAKISSNLTNYLNVFISDPRYPLNPESLELVRSATGNPSLESAGFLDYKMAYYKEVISQNNIYLLESKWLKFISITVKDDMASVIFDAPPLRKEFTVVLVDRNWYIAGSRGITTYEDNSPSSALATSISNTGEVQEIIRTIEAAYDIEAEAAYDFNTEKFQSVFINDQRYKTETNKLDFVRNFLDSHSMESAGYLDYKVAYYNWWHESALLFETAKEKAASENRELTQEELESIIDSEWAKKWGTAPARGKRPVREITLQFISVEVDGEIATVYIHDSLKAVILYLVRLDEKWYIAGAQEI